MKKTYRKVIAPFMEREITLAIEARECGDADIEFKHLERIHVVGQESTYWHVKAHLLMLAWAYRNYKPKELLGLLPKPPLALFPRVIPEAKM